MLIDETGGMLRQSTIDGEKKPGFTPERVKGMPGEECVSSSEVFFFILVFKMSSIIGNYVIIRNVIITAYDRLTSNVPNLKLS